MICKCGRFLREGEKRCPACQSQFHFRIKKGIEVMLGLICIIGVIIIFW